MELWGTSYSSRQGDRAVESDSVSNHDRGGGRGDEGDDDWGCGIATAVIWYYIELTTRSYL